LCRSSAVLASALAASLAAPWSPARADAEAEALAIATGVIVLASLITGMPERDEPDAVAFEVDRFGIDLECRFDNAMRLGLAYHHFSNGKVFGQSVNPGTEVIGLTFLLPLR
jgi:Lipid A 3-O-deacylase (PagL)